MKVAHALDTAGLTLLSGLVYFLLRQDAIHHIDANSMVRGLALPGYIEGYGHFGYRALLELVYSIHGDDAPIFGVARAMSGIAAALAIGVSHRALITLGMHRGPAALATIGVAGTTSLVHFATVFEVHTVFLLIATIDWWAFARYVRQPSHGRIVLVGIVSAIATAFHYSGMVLPLLGALALWCAQGVGRIGARSVITAWLLWSVTHIGGFVLLKESMFAMSNVVSDAATSEFLRDRLNYFRAHTDIAATLATVRYEWLQPFAPWSLAFLCAWIHRRLRRAVIAVLIGWLGFLAASVVTLCGAFELGAYALPMALPAAALCALTLRLRWMIAAIGIAFGLSLNHLAHPSAERIPTPEFGQDLHAWHQQHPHSLFLLGSYAEVDSLLVYAPPTAHHALTELEFVAWIRPDTPIEVVREKLVARAQGAVDAGGCLVFSNTAFAIFQMLPRNQEVLTAVSKSFTLEPVQHGTFHGIAFRPRPK